MSIIAIKNSSPFQNVRDAVKVNLKTKIKNLSMLPMRKPLKIEHGLKLER